MRVGLCGSFGFGNIGDEAIPLALSDLCALNNITAHFEAISRYDEVAMKGVTPRTAISRDYITQSRLEQFWHAGGGVVEPCRNSVLLRCGQAVKEHRQHMLAANVSSIRGYGFREKLQLKKRLKELRSISVRDASSYAALQDLFGVKADAVVGDLALWLQPEIGTPRAPEVAALAQYAIVNFCPIWANSEHFFSWAAMLVEKVIEVTGLPVAMLAMSEAYDSDTNIHKKIRAKLHGDAADQTTVIEGLTCPRKVMRTISESSLVVAMRLHANIMAYSQQVPFLAIEYDRKIQGFANTTNLPFAILSPNRLKDGGRGSLAFDPSSVQEASIAAHLLRTLSDSKYDRLEELKESLTNNVRAVLQSN